jgi:hypothetical protein
MSGSPLSMRRVLVILAPFINGNGGAAGARNQRARPGGASLGVGAHAGRESEQSTEPSEGGAALTHELRELDEGVHEALQAGVVVGGKRRACAFEHCADDGHASVLRGWPRFLSSQRSSPGSMSPSG